MVIFVGLLGLVAGSFVNALVWRLHQQSKSKKARKELSITKGRSVCPHCRHQLAVADLIPVLSWVWLGGRCQYCSKVIGWQYPVVELVVAVLFVISYKYWPIEISGVWAVQFAAWLGLITGFVALSVYDLKWFLLPNRLVYPLYAIGGVYALIGLTESDSFPWTAFDLVSAVFIGGGLFYVLFQVSKGKWIGGGDVRLGGLLGLVIGTATGSLLMIFLASVLGTVVALPAMLSGKAKKGSLIPFGPFLMAAAFIAVLWGEQIINWYRDIFIGG